MTRLGALEPIGIRLRGVAGTVRSIILYVRNLSSSDVLIAENIILVDHS